MNDQKRTINVIEPINPAFEKMKEILFNPFDLEKWFVIGFCAWLAFLGSRYSLPNFQGLSGYEGPRGGGGSEIQVYLSNNWYWLVPVFLFVFVVFLAIKIVFMWISSRGKFMFLYCVAHNQALIKQPWSRYKTPGNSLFVVRLFAGIAFFVVLFILGSFLAAAVLMKSGTGIRFTAPIVAGFIFSGLIVATASLAFAVFLQLTFDFVIPIMYLRGRSGLDAWKEFLGILNATKVKFLLYLLMKFAISIVVGMGILILVFMTCGCACCLLYAPYIGAVVLLPVSVFVRCYSLYFLRQFGPTYDVFAEQHESLPTSDIPS